MRLVPLRAMKLFALAGMGGALLTACGPPAKMIDQITMGAERTNQIKFLYSQGKDQGIVKCTVAADGALSQCRNMTVEFEE
jgi:hypothetical protein